MSKPGRPRGYSVENPRKVVKQIRWTTAEWAEIERKAAEAGESVAVYQRRKVLGWDL